MAPKDHDDNREQGRFEGRVMVRLDTLEERFENNNRVIYVKLDKMDEKITSLRISLGIGKGLVAIIASVVSAVVALVMTYFSRKT